MSTYDELAGNEDDDAAVRGGLGVRRAVLVLHLLEGERLLGCALSVSMVFMFPPARGSAGRKTYSELLSDTLGAERLGALEGEHRVLALDGRVIMSAK